MDEFRATDPLATLFDLAGQFARRTRRFVAIFAYAMIAAFFVLPLALVGTFWAAVTENWLLLAMAILAIPASVAIIILANSEQGFVLEFRRQLEMVARANSWTPNPPIPRGADSLPRLLAFLSADERYAKPRRVRVETPFRRRGNSGREIELTCRLLAKGSLWVWGPDSHQVLIRLFKESFGTRELETLKADVEEILRRKEWPLTRVVALVESPVISEELIEETEDLRVKYRSIGTRRPREVPIEVIAERPDGTYEQMPLFYVS